tara:strand:- start:3360 stop:3746 length:387 start_codon:yes stop_codon:yes gene_type:complete
MTRIGLTPIIDVVFILLIFFMLASNFNKVGELEMDMTKESSKSSNEDIKIIKLLIRPDKTILSKGKVYDDSDIITMLRTATKNIDKFAIVLTAKKDVTYQRYMNVMSFLKENEIENISIGIKQNEVKE